ncbi:MAG: hypothetical protein M3Y09_10460 [Actinomycetota bacterium]|nr:hypothetical protein [Actinomycetota bacterium]
MKCTTARFKELEDAEEIQFLAADSDAWGYGSGDVSSWPYYGLGMPLGHASQPIVFERVLAGEVQVRREIVSMPLTVRSVPFRAW